MHTKVLVTGAAGFIGFHLCKRLIADKYNVIGIDNINDYYDINLKKSRLLEIEKSLNTANKNWNFIKLDLENYDLLDNIFDQFRPSIVINLAAQAGVRYSIINPKSYINSNLVGFFNILELCRNYKVSNFIYASSSSVYGGNINLPHREVDNVDHPISLYAATKKSNEILAHSYSHLYGIPSTGLRLFTVYGPWGRPDMAPFIFTKSIIEGKPIKIYNHGNMKRDFTYIDDVIEVIVKCTRKPATPEINFKGKYPKPCNSLAPFKIFNLGNNLSIDLMDFIKIIEDELGIEAQKDYMKMQKGDVKETYADIEKLNEWIGFTPNTPIKNGINKFVSWFKSYYKI
tara:strand:+ start:2261 stop:3289 length:1029 start_codon:yes stop_codon:yes gene_type:complete